LCIFPAKRVVKLCAPGLRGGGGRVCAQGNGLKSKAAAAALEDAALLAQPGPDRQALWLSICAALGRDVSLGEEAHAPTPTPPPRLKARSGAQQGRSAITVLLTELGASGFKEAVTAGPVLQKCVESCVEAPPSPQEQMILQALLSECLAVDAAARETLVHQLLALGSAHSERPRAVEVSGAELARSAGLATTLFQRHPRMEALGASIERVGAMSDEACASGADVAEPANKEPLSLKEIADQADSASAQVYLHQKACDLQRQRALLARSLADDAALSMEHWGDSVRAARAKLQARQAQLQLDHERGEEQQKEMKTAKEQALEGVLEEEAAITKECQLLENRKLNLQKELQKVEADLYQAKMRHKAVVMRVEAAETQHHKGMQRVVEEASVVQEERDACRAELSTVATWQSFLEWLEEVGRQHQQGEVERAEASARAARAQLLQVSNSTLRLKIAEGQRLMERMRFCASELREVARQQQEGQAVGIGTDVASGLHAHEVAMTNQYIGDQTRLTTVLDDCEAMQVDNDMLLRVDEDEEHASNDELTRHVATISEIRDALHTLQQPPQVFAIIGSIKKEPEVVPPSRESDPLSTAEKTVERVESGDANDEVDLTQ